MPITIEWPDIFSPGPGDRHPFHFSSQVHLQDPAGPCAGFKREPSHEFTYAQVLKPHNFELSPQAKVVEVEVGKKWRFGIRYLT